MSFRNRGGGGRGFGGGRGRGQRGNRGGGYRGGGGGGGGGDYGYPDQVVELGYFTHTCQEDIVCHNTSGKIPYFNALVYFDNKEQIGKVDEIFGGIKNNGFTVKLQEGIKASSFKPDQKVYVDPTKLLPIDRFLTNNAGRRGRGKTRGENRGQGGGRGGRGFYRGGGDRGRGNFRRGGDRGGRGNSNYQLRGKERGSTFQKRGGAEYGNKRNFSGYSETPQPKKIRFDD